MQSVTFLNLHYNAQATFIHFDIMYKKTEKISVLEINSFFNKVMCNFNKIL